VSNNSVLVVDDDPSIRGMVGTVLRREGYDVEAVCSGNDAIARMADKAFDAIVLDVMMRDGSGQDVLEALASIRPDLKCVVIISASSQTNIDSVIGANVRAKLRKPFDIAALVAAIRTCLSETGEPHAVAS
jgi:two-component system, NtrC family, response regulator PilR